MNDLAIRTAGLTRDFGAVRAVDQLTLDVTKGTIFGFLGPNGSGKTTTIRLLLGLLEPTRGEANVLGFDIRSEAGEIRSRCGALLEHPGLYDRLSANDNLEFYGRIWHISAHERRNRIESLLKHVGLWERRHETVRTWSRGMKQKLAVARTLLHRPALVFLDEPTAGLDAIAASALRTDLTTLAAREGMTVFLTTHNLTEAEKLCAQVAVINKGRLLRVGSPDELRSAGGNVRVEVLGRGFSEPLQTALRGRSDVAAVSASADRLLIEMRGSAEAAPLVSVIAASGAQIEEIRKGTASLEEAFLDLVEDEG